MPFIIVDSKDGSKGKRFTDFARAKKYLDITEPVGRFYILDTETKRQYRDDRIKYDAQKQYAHYTDDTGIHLIRKPGTTHKEAFNSWWQGKY